MLSFDKCINIALDKEKYLKFQHDLMDTKLWLIRKRNQTLIDRSRKLFGKTDETELESVFIFIYHIIGYYTVIFNKSLTWNIQSRIESFAYIYYRITLMFSYLNQNERDYINQSALIWFYSYILHKYSDQRKIGNHLKKIIKRAKLYDGDKQVLGKKVVYNRILYSQVKKRYMKLINNRNILKRYHDSKESASINEFIDMIDWYLEEYNSTSMKTEQTV